MMHVAVSGGTHFYTVCAILSLPSPWPAADVLGQIGGFPGIRMYLEHFLHLDLALHQAPKRFGTRRYSISTSSFPGCTELGLHTQKASPADQGPMGLR